MKPERLQEYKNITVQPVFRLVNLFEESVEYDRRFCLPFHALSLCVRHDGRYPSWAEVAGTDGRIPYVSGNIDLTAARTPIHNRLTTYCRRLCIHFRYELFPGVDAFAGIHGRFRIDDPDGSLASRFRAVFTDTNPLRRFAMAESVALDAMRPLWPDKPAFDILRVAPYESALRAVQGAVTARTGVGDLAKAMELPKDHFNRAFRSLLGMAPKKWLDQALVERAKSLLSDRRRTIRDVAYTLNFSDEFHFSRFVKRCSSCSPSQIRSYHQGPESGLV